MASQPLSFAELLGGGILLTMGITGANVREVFAGKAGSIKPVAGSSSTAGGGQAPTASGAAGGRNASVAQLTANGYAYPLPKGEWSESRTDQGVDFVNTSAASRILAVGKARILATGAPGWPGGGGVLYELLDGPLAGKIIYAYENVKPQVHPGQVVNAGDVIATMLGTGYPWLEMGFADSSGTPLSHGEYTEGEETVYGKQFKALLKNLWRATNIAGESLGLKGKERH